MEGLFIEGLFQEFHLKKETTEEMIGALPEYVLQKLIKLLQDKGYKVLCSVDKINGVPTSIIIGKKLSYNDANTARINFTEVTEELSMTNWFVSGDSFLEQATS